MSKWLETISLDQWDVRYEILRAEGMTEPPYGGPLRRHLHEGDLRLNKLQFDGSWAALRLWNFLLTEEQRLRKARSEGMKIVGTMKDLGTVPVMAYSLPNVVAFYPDGAWWIPCLMERSAGLLAMADALGIDESFCPVRAMLGAFQSEDHFPAPDLVVCSVGAICDDFSAIAQRLEALGQPILWWEMPHRRHPDPAEPSVLLPGGGTAPRMLVEFVKTQLQTIRKALEDLSGDRLDDDKLSEGIRRANRFRRMLNALRQEVYTADRCPLPSLEMLIAEMLAIHFCSDQKESMQVIAGLLEEVRRRVACDEAVLPSEAARVFWVNPVADLRAMNYLESAGGRICGTDYLFTHALDEIPENIEPMQALAQMALADPMVGSAVDRAERIFREVQVCRAEAVVICRIPGASHGATEGGIIAQIIQARLHIPVVELEVPPVSDSMAPTLQNRLDALMEVVKERRRNDLCRN